MYYVIYLFLKTFCSLTKPGHTGETSRRSEGSATQRRMCIAGIVVQRNLLYNFLCCMHFGFVNNIYLSYTRGKKFLKKLHLE